MCEEEGTKKGEEVFGEFGGQIGKEAAVIAGRKAGLAKAVELLLEGGLEMAKVSGGEAGMSRTRLLVIVGCVRTENCAGFCDVIGTPFYSMP